MSEEQERVGPQRYSQSANKTSQNYIKAVPTSDVLEIQGGQSASQTSQNYTIAQTQNAPTQTNKSNEKST